MNATKALSQLGFVTARGLDNGEYGALLLSNKVKNIQNVYVHVTQYFVCSIQTTKQIHEMEERRRVFLKLEESRAEKRGRAKTEQQSREKAESKWSTGKVREELCLIHEAYQFFRLKYKKRYGACNPPPNTFAK